MWYKKFRSMFVGFEKCVFLNSAGVSLVSAPVKEAVIKWAEMGECALFEYEDTITLAKQLSARLIGASVDGIFISRNTTHGIHTFILGYPWQRGDEVIIGECEFPANRLPWLSLRSKGINVKVVPCKDYMVSCEDLIAACSKDTKVIAVSWVQYVSGYRIDIERLGEFCKHRGILLVVDAIQGVGVVPLSVEACNIDWLSADGHKWMCGPEGIGLVWTSKRAMSIIEPPCKGWFGVKKPMDFEVFDQEYAADASRYQDGSPMMLGIMAYNAALSMLLDCGIDNIYKRVIALSSYVIGCVKRRRWLLLTPEEEAKRAGIVSFKPVGKDVYSCLKALKRHNIICSFRGGWLRLSTHAYNNHTDIDRAFNVLDEVACN
ncbi:MAG: aminotransferase class V-fold PLP-dependent enzyme [Candidatus Magnetoovum sp. WYHC-5]|nr:aminotransferase class V-fold PLP-dependent enzyme [Candidatus Magnetoovum sp. WYHC-5]